MEQFSDTIANRIKAHTRALIKSIGGTEAAALYCRLGKAQLSNCENIHTDQFLPIDVLLDLTAATGDTRLIDDLVSILTPSRVNKANLMASMTAANKEGFEVINAGMEAMADGVFTREELLIQQKETGEAIGAYTKHLDNVTRQLEGKGK